MVSFIKLIHNENIKIFKRLGTLVMIGVLILFVGIHTFASESNDDPNWQKALQQENLSAQKALAGNKLSPQEKSQIEETVQMNQYRLSNDIQPLLMHEYLLSALVMLVYLITLFAIIHAGTSVAGEFNDGTIKFLLIRPHSRIKILLAKYMSLLMFVGIMVMIVAFTLLILGGFKYGFEGLVEPSIYWEQNQMVTQTFLLQWIQQIVLVLVSPLAMMTLAFMISTIFRSSSLAIGLGIFSYFVGGILVSQLASRGHDWTKYLLFANTDLTIYFSNMKPLVEGMTFSFSLVVVSIYLTTFLLSAFITFSKRDIAS
ncbi:ABC transporter permease subunit [Hazenella sp. IB182353]|uniref:ABC transporter permease n=1 Tax=Polycladospora coralii TaxID=2771432 RepID=UPI00174683D4|nr:ABC transporter permease subunit [Polycladospora coralii]MBS7530601.1 ABC transporter permease subunit [Polycladospora coralii]